jgi:TolA-binding protein
MFAHLRFLLLSSSMLLFYAFSCKTAEQIEREQAVERLDTEVKGTLKTNADLVSRIAKLEENLGQVTGQFEEKDYEKRKVLFTEMRKLEAKILILEDSNKSLTESVSKIQASQQEQKQYLEKVLSTLNSMGGSKSSSKSEKKKEQNNSPYQEAMKLYSDGKYAQSKTLLLDLANSEKGNKLARVLHNLGMISFMDKKDDEALVYFSKLYSNHPKSDFTPNGLIYMSKTLNRQGKKEEAKAALNEVIKTFPGHKKAKEASDLIKKI